MEERNLIMDSVTLEIIKRYINSDDSRYIDKDILRIIIGMDEEEKDDLDGESGD